MPDSHRFPRGSLFYRRLDRDFPLAASAFGCWITLASGRRILDGAGGAMVANLGHGRAELAAAVAEAIGTLGYVNGTQFTNRYAEELAQELAPVLPPGLGYCYFLGSGSEAIEAAVKLARQVSIERGHAGKWKVVTRVPSYHGNTLTALSLSGREHYRRAYGPLLTEFPRIPAPDGYRDPQGPGSTGAALEQEILRQDPATVAAFIAEPIGGSATGAAVPTRAYLRTVAETCRRQDVLWIADEVLTGMGRTGRWFACQHFDETPDIMVLGKGLNGGALPLSAVVAKREILDTIARGTGAFNHAQTYSHTPAICAAGLATVRILKRERLVERVAALEPFFFAELEKLRASPLVGDIRGRGLLAGIEFVRDRATKEPFPRSARIAEQVVERAFEEGLVVWPNTGHVDGHAGDLVMVAPPFVIDAAEIAQLGARLRRAIEGIAGA